MKHTFLDWVVTLEVHDEDDLSKPSRHKVFEVHGGDPMSVLDECISHRLEDDPEFEDMSLPMGELLKMEAK